MRDLALHVAASGHDVTYVTMRHWDESERPNLAGVRVLGLTPAGRVYQRERRTLMPPLRFGLAVARHLWRHGSEYDIVHMASFPYFPVLAASAIGTPPEVRARRELARDLDEGLLAPLRGTGRSGRSAGSCSRRASSLRTPRTASRDCMRSGWSTPGTPGRRCSFRVCTPGPADPTPATDVDPDLVVYAGRHVQEKRVDQLVRGFALARRDSSRPSPRAVRRRPDTRVRRGAGGGSSGSTRRSCLHGRRPEEEVAEAIARSACLVTASEREGYGLVVVEAAAHGTPSVVVEGPENAATELVRDGVNGVVSPDASPESLARAISRVIAAGPALRESTARWFAENAKTLTIDGSLELVVEGYGRVLRPAREARG